jgi:hypothetical protein
MKLLLVLISSEMGHATVHILKSTSILRFYCGVWCLVRFKKTYSVACSRRAPFDNSRYPGKPQGHFNYF